MLMPQRYKPFRYCPAHVLLARQQQRYAAARQRTLNKEMIKIRAITNHESKDVT